MFKNTIYSVAWWTGTGTKVSIFLSYENADAFAKRMKTNGLFIASGAMRDLPPEQYKKLSRECIDYEPPKKN